jgi:hypothetical protein
MNIGENRTFAANAAVPEAYSKADHVGFWIKLEANQIAGFSPHLRSVALVHRYHARTDTLDINV